MAHTVTQLRAAAKQGATIVSTHTACKGQEVTYSPMYRGDLHPWVGVEKLNGVGGLSSDMCDIVWKPGCRTEVHVPTIAKLVRRLFEDTEHKRSNMPENGGWAVSQTYWDTQSVAFVYWAYAGIEPDGMATNLLDRGLSPEVRQMHEMLKAQGYFVSNLREDCNFFHVTPKSI